MASGKRDYYYWKIKIIIKKKQNLKPFLSTGIKQNCTEPIHVRTCDKIPI